MSIAFQASSPVYSADLVVNSERDTHDLNPGDGVCLDNYGGCSLRAAIEESNANGEPDVITFAEPYDIMLRPGPDLVLTEGHTTILGNGGDVHIYADSFFQDNLVLASNYNVIRGLTLAWGGNGITIEGSFNVIGGDLPEHVNEIHGTTGIWVQGDENVIEGNHISGTSSHGIGIGGNGNTVRRNRLWHNSTYQTTTAIVISSAHDNVIQENVIGLNPSGEPALNDRGIHVAWASTGNIIGGDNPAQGNVVAYSRGPGIWISGGEGSFGNTIRFNSIYENDELGILIDPPGAQDGIQPPELESATVTEITGTVDRPGIVDVYIAAPDPWGFGEGQSWVGSTTVGEPGPFTVDVNGLSAADVVTATVTDASGNTSEFSRNVDVNGPPTADAGLGEVVLCGAIVYLDGSGSSDPDGDVLTFEWQLVSRPTGSEAVLHGALTHTPSFVADRPGTYEVTLTVSEPQGGKDVATVQVLARSRPLATFNHAPATDLTTASVIAFADSSSDEDGRIVGWQWEFGDGATSNIPNPSHQYAVPGIYHVSLIVTDDDGLSSDPARAMLAVGTPEARVEGLLSEQAPPGNYTMDASALGGIMLVKSGPGTPLMTVATYGGNPVDAGVGLFIREGSYFDVNLDSAEGVDAVELSWVAGSNVDPSDLHLMWYDESADTWKPVSPQQVSADASGVVRIVAHLYGASSPTVAQLSGTIFAGGANAPPTVTILAPEAGTVWKGEKTIRWAAADPDGDDDAVTIDLAYTSEGGNWVLIATDEANDGQHLWDTSVVPAGGVYRVRVTATDTRAGSAEATSEPFAIVKIAGRVAHGPNPASDIVTFYFAGLAAGRLYVYDAAGRLVWQAMVAEGLPSLQWDLRSTGGAPLGNGLYLYRIVLDDGSRSEVRRLVIQR